MHQQQTAFENIVGKEEIAHYEQFLLFPQCFLLNQIIVPHLSVFLTSYFHLLMNWHMREKVKKEQNFGLYQIGSICSDH